MKPKFTHLTFYSTVVAVRVLSADSGAKKWQECLEDNRLPVLLPIQCDII